MIVTLHTHRLQTLDQVREFLDGSRTLDLQTQTRADAYALVAKTVQRFDYLLQGKADKGVLRRFLAKVTGLSRAQLTRLLTQHRTTGEVADRRGAPRRPFPRRYTSTDIGLLAEVDTLHGTLSGPATRKLCARAYHLFDDRRFERLAAISNGHLYNLRHSTSYQRRRGTTPTPTRPVQVAIGERRRPQPFGQPGYVRVDSVHQGDLDGIKGLYHLNLVDEVTQFQFVGSVEHSTRPAWPRFSTPCCGRFRSPSRASTPTTARSTSTATSRRCCRRCTSTNSPSPEQRQRPGREQERLGHPQAPRLRPHPQPLRRTGQRLHPAGPLAVPQLPPAPASSPPSKSTPRAASASATAMPTS